MAAGECLFLGASGSKRGEEDWEITFRFAASPNRTGITVGDITGIAKKGWEYLWVRYADAEDAAAKALVKKPVAVYVEKVYEDGDFSGLGIGTSMGDALKKVQSGDPLVIPAAGVQRLHRRGEGLPAADADVGQQATPGYRSAGIVLVKNESGEDRDRFDIAGPGRSGDPARRGRVGRADLQECRRAAGRDAGCDAARGQVRHPSDRKFDSACPTAWGGAFLITQAH